MKKTVSRMLIVAMALMLCLSFGTVAYAGDAISSTISVSPSTLTGPGTVSVSVTINNTGDPVTNVVLSYPAPSQDQISLGDLATGQSTNHTNTQWAISEEMLNTDLKFTVAWTSVDGSRKTGLTDSVPIKKQEVEVKVSGSASVNETHVKAGDEVSFTFNITNEGNVPLTEVTLKASPIKNGGAINDEAFSIDPGGSKKIEFNYTANETIEVSPVFSYMANGQRNNLTLDKITLNVDQPQAAEMSISVKANKTEVEKDGVVTFTVTVRNVGMASLTGFTVTDFNGNKVDMSKTSLAAGDTATGESAVEIVKTGNYSFTATANDPEGASVTARSDALTVTVGEEETPIVADPSKALILDASISNYMLKGPNDVDLTVTVTNNTDAELKNIQIKEQTTGKTEEIATLEARESREWSTILEVDETTEYTLSATAELPDGSIVEVKTQPVQITVEEKSGMDTNQIVLIVIIVAIAAVAVALVLFIRKNKNGPKSSARDVVQQEKRSPEQQGRPAQRQSRMNEEIEHERPRKEPVRERIEPKPAVKPQPPKKNGDNNTHYGDRNKF